MSFPDLMKNREKSIEICKELPPYIKKTILDNGSVYVPQPDIEVTFHNVEDAKRFLEEEIVGTIVVAICSPASMYIGAHYIVVIAYEGTKVVIRIKIDTKKAIMEDGKIKNFN